MTNADIANVLEQIADLLEFQGANPFRIRAYRNGARAINDLPESVEDVVADPDRRLTDIAGIGKDLADKVATLVETGQVRLPSQSEYVAAVVDVLERLPPECVIERLSGTAPPDSLIGPAWSADGHGTRRAIERALADRNTWQGRLHDPRL